ncbi:MAG: hypothetical protein LBB18_04660 [Puniceicoccales bacterium]|nr:hypothetical protein [Puniceicoccales bacterium]
MEISNTASCAKGATKRWPAQNGPNAKLHLAVGDHPLRIIATEGTKAGYKPALELSSRGRGPIIPPRISGKFQRLCYRSIISLFMKNDMPLAFFPANEEMASHFRPGI